VRHRGADQRGHGLPGRRRGSGPLGERPSVSRALPGLPRPRRVPHGRGRERAALEGVLRGAGRAGVGGRPAVRLPCPRGPSTTSARCSRTRRSGTARWPWRWTTRPPAG
jgi:hypothetical protein